MFQYAEANDDLLPGEKWDVALHSIEPDPVTYACPHQRRVDPKSSGYAMNRVLAGKALGKIEAPATTILVFDSKPTVPGVLADPADVPRPARHRNGRVNNAAYADGRVAEFEP
jgi:prepilin-type processing-associated H-X9-DG protein